MPITKASGQAVAPAAKGDLVVGSATNDAAVLAVGTNDYVLTADSSTATGLKWAAAGGGGANWSLLNAGGTSLSGATTITVSGISAKNAIMVLVDAASTTSPSNSTISVRLNADTGSNYFNVGSRTLFGGTYSAGILSPIDSMETGIIIGRMGDSSSSIVSAYVLLNGCNSAGVKIFNCAGTGSTGGGSGQYGVNFGGYYSGSSTISSVSVFSSDGNFDAGLVYVYTTA